MDVIMHAHFERINAVRFVEMEVLGFQCAKGAFNRCVVKAVAFAAHALLDTMTRQHRSVGLHLVVPTLVGVHDQVSGELGARERCLECAGNHLEDWPPCHAVRDDLAVVQVHAGRQIELVAAYIELGDIGRPLLVRRGCAEVALQNVGYVHIARARDTPRTLPRPDQRTQPHFCIRRCTHLWLTGSAIESHSAAVIRRYP